MQKSSGALHGISPDTTSLDSYYPVGGVSQLGKSNTWTAQDNKQERPGSKPMSLRDRQRGALLGLAVGDALGAAIESRKPGTFEEVTDYRGGGPHTLGPGESTDDTSMVLALADSISDVGWDINDQAARYVKWWRIGAYSFTGRCFDIGMTTVAALQRFERSGDARTSGDRSERASGNGSIMRLAPVPVRFVSMFPDEMDALVGRVVESSLPTHASSQCLSACVYLTVVLCGLIVGRPREEVLDPEWEPMRRARGIAPFHPEVADVATRGEATGVKKAVAVHGAFRVTRNHIRGFDEEGCAVPMLYPDAIGRACRGAYEGNVVEQCAVGVGESAKGLWKASHAAETLFVECGRAPKGATERQRCPGGRNR